MKQKRFILSLPDDLTERIEAYRIERGLKSSAEAHRALIEAGLARLSDPAVFTTKTLPRIAETVRGAGHLTGGGPKASLGRERPKPGSLLKKR